MANSNTPTLGVGAVVLHHDAVLLVKRSNPPNAGQWAIPGGKVNLGETLQQAAEREILEETGLHIRANEVIYHFEIIERDNTNNVKWHYVVLDLKAIYLSGDPHAASDVSEARWITRSEFPGLPVNQTTRELLKTHYQFP